MKFPSESGLGQDGARLDWAGLGAGCKPRLSVWKGKLFGRVFKNTTYIFGFEATSIFAPISVSSI